MLPSFANKSVTITRAPWIETRGTRERDWSNAEIHTVRGCSIQPANTFSDRNQREAVEYDAVLYAPENADIQAGDKVTYNGRIYLVQGAPMLWESPTGAVSHLQVMLGAQNG